ncbi:alpha/beta fold hydrolase [Massilia sp. Mn16-1_5]|uniref:alpha/beta fold hydrolase n=1 Tax=Massilia sp. Mn16-1_5 TaxID=2079199 RepID=UPI00109EA080|nr:alpha/beta hydrolase [Massilia sp. Mn16-1_5]THC45229.1 alpha/beta hydrolase [Massilia sp. Mn16-1_5]
MSAFAHLSLQGAPVRLEYQWVGVPDSTHPTVVFLHEGLGSIALWKDFPEQLCRAAGMRGLVFSREGYGRSTPRPHEQRWPVGFMHRQAWEVLPALLQELGIDQPWLFGHSDGASIALLHAARFPVAGLIVAAPHIIVEDISVESIEQAREAYLAGGLRERLARYHEDIDSAFWGWNDIWLDPAFRAWDIREHLPAITAPLLAIQGEDDEYGTLEQIYGIARLAPQTQLLVLPQCGHSPHRDQAGRLIDAATRFMTGIDRAH